MKSNFRLQRNFLLRNNNRVEANDCQKWNLMLWYVGAPNEKEKNQTKYTVDYHLETEEMTKISTVHCLAPRVCLMSHTKSIVTAGCELHRVATKQRQYTQMNWH